MKLKLSDNKLSPLTPGSDVVGVKLLEPLLERPIMASTSEQARQQVKKSWARAHKLAEMADVKTSVARSYIKENPQVVSILNGNVADKRSPHVRNMIDGCQAHHRGGKRVNKTTLTAPVQRKTAADYRASKGDSTQPPRAGAPQALILPTAPSQSLTDTIQTLQAWKDRHDALGDQIQNCIQALEDQQTYAGG